MVKTIESAVVTGMVVKLLWSAALFVLGAVFLGISVCNGFCPDMALAGCALIYVGKVL